MFDKDDNYIAMSLEEVKPAPPFLTVSQYV